MDLGLDIPTDEFFAEWLEKDNCNNPTDAWMDEWLEKDSCDVNHTPPPPPPPRCFISRQERKTRIIKEHLENYIFITQPEINFTLDQFREMVSAYLHLDYEFQLLKVESNKFILTLETQMPTDYACAMLEGGKMIRLAESDIVCYPTDEYAEGYFGGDMDYHMDDEVAELHIDVQIHGLPLHLRTIKAVERILLRYCIVQSFDDDCLSSKKLDCVRCTCWAQSIMFPIFIIIRVSSKFSRNLPLLSSTLQKQVQTYCVGITVRPHGFVHPTAMYREQSNRSFARAAEGGRVGYCFLRDADVPVSRIEELQSSVLLKPKQFGLATTIEEIAAGLRATVPHIDCKLDVQCIGVQGYIARSTGLPLPQLLRELVGVDKDIMLSSRPFSWLPWTTSFGAVSQSLPNKLNIQTRNLLPEFLAPTIVEDLLSPFCMFDTDGYNPGPSPDTDSYSSVVWTHENATIPWFILVRAAPAFCKTTISQGRELVELTIMTAQNRGPGIETYGYN